MNKKEKFVFASLLFIQIFMMSFVIYENLIIAENNKQLSEAVLFLIGSNQSIKQNIDQILLECIKK